MKDLLKATQLVRQSRDCNPRTWPCSRASGWEALPGQRHRVYGSCSEALSTGPARSPSGR